MTNNLQQVKQHFHQLAVNYLKTNFLLLPKIIWLWCWEKSALGASSLNRLICKRDNASAMAFLFPAIWNALNTILCFRHNATSIRKRCVEWLLSCWLLIDTTLKDRAVLTQQFTHFKKTEKLQTKKLLWKELLYMCQITLMEESSLIPVICGR